LIVYAAHTAPPETGVDDAQHKLPVKCKYGDRQSIKTNQIVENLQQRNGFFLSSESTCSIDEIVCKIARDNYRAS
jgi:hypothetical protein